jgi:ribosomal protein L11 methyltransferase
MSTPNKSYVEVQIETGAEAAELLAAALVEVTGGVEIRDAQTLLATAPDRAAVVALCPPEEVTALLAVVDETLALARAGGTAVDPVAVRQRAAHEDEWRDVWKQFFRATRIGRRFVVRPSWDPAPTEPAEHVIDLDPGRAFGTGAHPTTRLVIALAETWRDERPELARFLDLGCGSGILSIAAARLWPRAEGLAVDVDPEATACSLENFDRNAVRGVRAVTGTLDDADGSFDLVLANIQADVLLSLTDALPARVRPGGRLILSGLLASDVDPVRPAYERAGFVFVERRDEGEWSALAFSR